MLKALKCKDLKSLIVYIVVKVLPKSSKRVKRCEDKSAFD